jgi:hypothetical protein
MEEPHSSDQDPEETKDVNIGAPKGEIGSMGEGEALGEYVPYPDQAGVPEELTHRESTSFDEELGT